MLVDPTILRLFASQTHDTAATITASEFSEAVAESGAGLPGSSVQWATDVVSLLVQTTAEDLAQLYAQMATTARGNADSYEVTEQHFAESLDKLAVDS